MVLSLHGHRASWKGHPGWLIGMLGTAKTWVYVWAGGCRPEPGHPHGGCRSGCTFAARPERAFCARACTRGRCQAARCMCAPAAIPLL